MNISIVYVNYKTARLILDSIKSVKEKTEDVDYEIIVVDNASGDGSLELIQKQYPEVICVQADENMGFGRANNLGMTYASGDCILFLNPDTILRNDAIDKLYAYLIEHLMLGLVVEIYMMSEGFLRLLLAGVSPLLYGSFYLFYISLRFVCPFLGQCISIRKVSPFLLRLL